MEMYDYKGNPVTHDFASVNGIRMHYVIAGEGPVLLLLHGTPKSNYYWCDVMPLLTKHFTVVAPDFRGFGYTDKPGASSGYDSLTMVQDLDELMTGLGFDRFYIHGEDRGAEYGFVYAAKHKEKVIAMSYGEMAVSGYGIEEASYYGRKPDRAVQRHRQVAVARSLLLRTEHPGNAAGRTRVPVLEPAPQGQRV